MGFIVVARDRNDLSLGLLLSREFSSREEALDAVRAECATCDPGDLLMVDLETALPVLVVRTESALQDSGTVEDDAALEAVSAEAILDPESIDASADEIVAGQYYSTEPVALKDALQRAADALEANLGESTFAADEAPEPAAEEPLAVDEEPVAEGAAEDVPTEAPAEETASAETVDEEAAPEGEPAEVPAWPWDGGSPSDPVELTAEDTVPEDSVHEDEPAAEEAPSADDSVAGAEYVVPVTVVDAGPASPYDDPAVDAADLVPGPVIAALDESGDMFVPRPVIMGDYADEPGAWQQGVHEPQGATPTYAADESAPEAPEADGAEQAEEPPSVDTPASDIASVADSLAAIGAGIGESLDESEPAFVPEADGLHESTIEEPGEGGAALDMSAYTCEDCVYLNTCPQRHDNDPSNCGLFQWRS